jgi:hypothetical protein
MKKTFCLIICSVLLLVGCANTSTVKLEKFPENTQSALIVPTGAFKIDAQSLTWGSAFGALGAIAEQSLNKEKLENRVSILKSIYTEEYLESLVNAELKKSLQKKLQKVEISARTNPAMQFTDWFNPESREDFLRINNPNNSLIIDYGFQGINISSNVTGKSVSAIIGLRVIDPKTGKVIARAREYKFGGVSIESKNSDENSSEFRDAVKIAFQKLFDEVINNAILKVGI